LSGELLLRHVKRPGTSAACAVSRSPATDDDPEPQASFYPGRGASGPMRTLPSRVASAPAGRQADGAELIVLSCSGSLERGRASVVREPLETAPSALLIVPSDAAAG